LRSAYGEFPDGEIERRRVDSVDLSRFVLPRLRARALPPIGRPGPANALPQLARALAAIGVGLAVAAMAAESGGHVDVAASKLVAQG